MWGLHNNSSTVCQARFVYNSLSYGKIIILEDEKRDTIIMHFLQYMKMLY